MEVDISDSSATAQEGEQGTGQTNLDHSYIRGLTLQFKKMGLTIDTLRLMDGA